ncbi:MULTISPECIES: response regulator [Asticcacaulis]|uniref:response regulator n=1 Tax=Asticcacaulis TaxID=76890 RepID=UPI001AEA0465|nr:MULTISPECIES: response regulator [Asticcacaulis]MBP2160335.1 two-component system KDP operon response regulator KdpE [Asticcacaulis solisilvae]MDR6801362.1 two-component system KDP operon response regulator KdpE [Asticcacaulis sp. BE141]
MTSVQNPRVLIVEDQADLRRYVRSTLSAHDMTPVEAATAREAMQAATAHRPDVILLDLGLPDRDGMEIIAEVREWSQVPIIVLSAREQESDKIAALDLGADDYLTKPFSGGELIARIRVALRHAARHAAGAAAVYERDGLRVDFEARTVSLDGEAVRLTPIEYRLLVALAKNAGRVVTHAQLIREVWGRHGAEDNTYLRIHTQHLREKLSDDPLRPRFILTEPGVGYRLKG